MVFWSNDLGREHSKSDSLLTHVLSNIPEIYYKATCVIFCGFKARTDKHLFFLFFSVNEESIVDFSFFVSFRNTLQKYECLFSLSFLNEAKRNFQFLKITFAT